MKKLSSLLLLITLFITSCSKEEINVAKKLEGRWLEQETKLMIYADTSKYLNPEDFVHYIVFTDVKYNKGFYHYEIPSLEEDINTGKAILTTNFWSSEKTAFRITDEGRTIEMKSNNDFSPVEMNLDENILTLGLSHSPDLTQQVYIKE